MEANERPSKKRRLSHDDLSAIPEASSKKPSQVEHPSEPNSAQGPEQIQQEESHDDHALNEAGDLPNGTTEDGLPPPTATAPLAAALPDPLNGNPPLSKNQQKKVRRQQEWEAKKPQRKLVKKQKLAAKRERKREAYANLGPEHVPETPLAKAKAVQLPITFLIDCDFDDLMLDNERISLAGQVTRSYSENRRASFRAHLAVCSFGGKLRHRFDNVLGHYKGWKGVRFLDCDFVEAAQKAGEWMAASSEEGGGGELAAAFAHLSPSVDDELSDSKMASLKEQGEIVYLTSEGENTLTELKPYSTYIIGGLVDKNREKGICYKRATRRGVKTAKLPIGEFMDMTSRKVLATNHVNEVMLKWLECGDWGEAFLQVIPKRKGGKLKEVGEDNGAGGQDEKAAEDEDEEDVEQYDDEGDDAGEKALTLSDHDIL